MSKYTLVVQRLGLSAVANLLSTFSSVILLVILTKSLSVADFGSWSLIVITIGLVPMFTTLGLPAAMVRFLAAAKDKKEIQETFYSLGFVVFVASSIVCGMFLLVAPQVATSLFHNNLRIALILPLVLLIACLNVFVLQYFITFQQMKKFAVLSFLQAYITVAFVAVFIFLGYGLAGAVTALLIQELAVFSLTIYLIVSQIGFAAPALARVRPHLAYGLPLVPSSLSSWIVASSDRYLVGLFLGTAAVGYYSSGYGVGTIISLFSAPVVWTFHAVLSKRYDEDNIDEVRTILTSSLKYYAGIAIPSVFALSVLSKPLLVVFTTPQIAANAYFVTPLVAAATALAGAYEVFLLGLVLKKRTAIVGTVWVLSAILNFGLNFVLIPYLGIIGAAATTLLAYALAFTLTALYSRRFFKFDTNGGFIIKSVCASAIGVLFLLSWDPSGILSIFLSIVFAAIIYLGILLALRGLTVQEIKTLYAVFKGSY